MSKTDEQTQKPPKPRPQQPATDRAAAMAEMRRRNRSI